MALPFAPTRGFSSSPFSYSFSPLQRSRHQALDFNQEAVVHNVFPPASVDSTQNYFANLEPISNSTMSEYAIVKKQVNIPSNPRGDKKSVLSILEIKYGGCAVSHRAAIIIQRTFRAFRLRKHFSQLMSLALTLDHPENRESFLKKEDHPASCALPNKGHLRLNSPINSIDQLILEAAGIPINQELRQCSVTMPLRRSLSLRSKRSNDLTSISLHRSRSGNREKREDAKSVVPPCPPLRGEEFYKMTEQTKNQTSLSKSRSSHNEPPRPPQRTVSFLAHDNLPRKLSFLREREQSLDVTPKSEVTYQYDPRHQIHIDSNLCLSELSSNHLHDRCAHYLYLKSPSRTPNNDSKKNLKHQRSFSSPVPVQNYSIGTATNESAIIQDVTRETESPLPPPPYVPPPSHRPPPDFPLPPPPPPPPSTVESVVPSPLVLPMTAIPNHLSCPNHAQSDRSSSSSSIDSGYGRSLVVEPNIEHGHSSSVNLIRSSKPVTEITKQLGPLRAQRIDLDSEIQNRLNHARQAISRTELNRTSCAKYENYANIPWCGMMNPCKKSVRIQVPDPISQKTSADLPTNIFSHQEVDDGFRRRQYRVGLTLFNQNPDMGVNYLLKKQFVDFSPSATAAFLLGRKGLSKSVVGEYLTNLQRPFNLAVLHCFIHRMDFTGLHLDIALRQLQQEVTLPKEAQKIEKIVEVFSKRYIQCNEMFALGFQSQDTIFILSYAIVLLNTDLHSRAVRSGRRMRREDFIRNLKGVDAGQDLDLEMLQGIYDRIRNTELRPGSDHVTQVIKVEESLTGKGRNDLALAEPHRRLVCFCRLTEVTDKNRIEKKAGAHQRGLFLFNDVLVNTKTVISKKKTQHQYRGTILLNEVRVAPFSSPQFPYGIQLQDRLTGKVVLTFNARSLNDQQRFLSDLQESIAETIDFEHAKMILTTNKESLC